MSQSNPTKEEMREAVKAAANSLAAYKEAFEKSQLIVQYRSFEAQDYFNALVRLFNAVQNDSEDKENAIKEIKNILRLLIETGTTPTVWGNPVFRNLAQELWKATSAAFEKQLGINEPGIERNIFCKTCGVPLKTFVGISCEYVTCPRCHSIVKW